MTQLVKDKDAALAKVTEALGSADKVKAQAQEQIQTAAKQVETLQGQVTQLVKDKDAALAKVAEALSAVDKFKAQVQEQIQKITSLQEQNAKLQQLVDDLKKKLSEVKLPGISIP